MATKKKSNSGFMKAMTPSPTLAQIVGSKPLPRTEVTKKIWAYIKKHGLQDAKDKRVIVCDATLKDIIGKPRVNMFAMTAILSKHLS